MRMYRVLHIIGEGNFSLWGLDGPAVAHEDRMVRGSLC